jgi:hypothetical protein
VYKSFDSAYRSARNNSIGCVAGFISGSIRKREAYKDLNSGSKVSIESNNLKMQNKVSLVFLL